MDEQDSAVTKAPPPRIHVCGIGASAGGIEALQSFFTELPNDLGLAYVVVVHLAPDKKSELPALIGRWTSMPIAQVGDHDKAALHPNHVYVIAPDRKLEITDTSVGASRFEQTRGPRTAIDLFFRSLARTHGDGFAVILSGSGSDGALGARAVKESGGLVLVQDPREAMHPDMPRSVIETGVADVILPIRQLVGRLAELARGKEMVSPVVSAAEDQSPIPETEERALRGIFDLLRKRTGHDFSKYKRNTTLRRLARRMQLRHQSTIHDYLQDLLRNGAEVQGLFEDLLISVTSFFRDREAWAALEARVIAPLVDETDPGAQLRAWVPACATGEEAYSLAIAFHEEFERRQTRRELIIFASDVDEAALGMARLGRYPRAIAADVSEARLNRYFTMDDDHYQMKPGIRDNVVFAVHNVLRDPPFSRLDLISCRNLLIYLDRELQEQAMSVFRYACRDRGYLFLGASEVADDQAFHAIDAKHRIFVSRDLSDGVRPPLPHLLAPVGSATARLGRAQPVSRGLAAEVHVSALEELAPPSLVVDERWTVLHMSNSVSRFLQQSGGPPALRVTDLVRPELRDELHAVLHNALEGDEPRLSPFVPVRFNGATRRVAMLVQPRPAAADRPRHVLIMFLDGGPAANDLVSVEADDPSDVVRLLRERLRQAEQRIESVRDDYYLTNEDLRAANEELQSLNEEYRSTTEELETSKEELQSINEELQTVNHELKLKLEETSQANSDLENLMAATDVATLFLDRECRITRFTPQLSEIFNVKPRDRARPISDLTHNLDYGTLEVDARRVLDTLQPIALETTSQDGRIFVTRLRPYRKLGGGDAEGVVATFIDVTAIKRTEAALRESEQKLAAELEVMRLFQEMTMAAATATTMRSALDSILETAMRLQGAEFGNIQILNPESQQLRIVAHRGFGEPFLRAFEAVDATEDVACGRALRTRESVSIEDVELESGFDRHRAIVAAAGYRAVHSEPLIGKSGQLVGVLSVHFRNPRSFSERNRRLGALLARQAADLIVNRTQQDTVVRLNQALSARTAELEESEARLAQQTAQLLVQDRNKEDFLAALGHELRNPLAAIANSLEVISPADESSRGAIAILRRQVLHMTRLVNDLLDMARINRGELRVQRGPVELTACVLESVAAARRVADARHVSLEVDMSEPPIAVEADRERLVQILGNLLDNALKFTERGSIAVRVRRESTHAVIAIRDTGIGIEPGRVSVLLEPFSQSEEGRRRGGLGLGLSLVRRLVELHEGELTVESEGPGAGTRVTFTLPLTRSDAPSALAATPAPTVPRRILVVEDNPDVGEMLTLMLRGLGHDVEAVDDGEAAIELARRQRPEIALVDITMPGVSGAEVARRLRDQFSAAELTLVALSGYPKEHPAVQGAPFDRHLLKPATPESIVALLSSLQGETE